MRRAAAAEHLRQGRLGAALAELAAAGDPAGVEAAAAPLLVDVATALAALQPGELREDLLLLWHPCRVHKLMLLYLDSCTKGERRTNTKATSEDVETQARLPISAVLA